MKNHLHKRRLTALLCAVTVPLSVISAAPAANALSLHGVVLSSPNIGPESLVSGHLSAQDQANIDILKKLEGSRKSANSDSNATSVEDEYLHQIIQVNLGRVVVGNDNPDLKTFSFVVSSSDRDNPTFEMVPFTGTLMTATTNGTPVKLTFNASNGSIVATAVDGTLNNTSFPLPTVLLKRNTLTDTTYNPRNGVNDTPFIGAWEVGTNRLVAISPTSFATNGDNAVPDETGLRAQLSLSGVQQKISNANYKNSTLTSATAQVNVDNGQSNIITEMLTRELEDGTTANFEVKSAPTSPINIGLNTDGFFSGVRLSTVSIDDNGNTVVTLLQQGRDWSFAKAGSKTNISVKTKVQAKKGERFRLETAFPLGQPNQTMIGAQQDYALKWNRGRSLVTLNHTQIFGIKTPTISTGATVDTGILGGLKDLSSGDKNPLKDLSSDDKGPLKDLSSSLPGKDDGDKTSGSSEDTPDPGTIIGVIAGVAAIATVIAGGGWAATHMDQIMNMMPKPPAPPAPPAPPKTDPKQLVVPRPGSGDAVVRCPNPRDHAAVNIVNAQLERQGNPDRCRIL